MQIRLMPMCKDVNAIVLSEQEARVLEGIFDCDFGVEHDLDEKHFFTNDVCKDYAYMIGGLKTLYPGGKSIDDIPIPVWDGLHLFFYNSNGFFIKKEVKKS